MNYETLSRIPRYCAYWSKKKPVNTDRWLRTLLQQYLDEHTKTRPAGWGTSGVSVSEAERRERVASGQEPLLPGADYSPFASGIWVFGHVANKVAEAGKSPAFGQPQEVVGQVADWWVHDRREGAVKAHHIIASFEPRIAAELHRRGYPVDAMLLASVHQTLSQYAARFYPGETLGWVAGCHHDKGVPHVHALLHPATARGKLLRMSGKKDGEAGEDRFEFLRANFNTRARQLFVALTQQPEARKEVEKLSARQFMVLAYHAVITASAESMDSLSAATALLKHWTGSREYSQVLQEAVYSATAALHDEPSPGPEPDAVRANWDRVRASLDSARATTLEAGIAALGVVSSGRSSLNSYRPFTSPHASPAVPLVKQYYELAGRPTGKHVTNTLNAVLARRKESDRQRVRFNETLKAYRDSVEMAQAVLDQTHLRAANGALRLATIASTALHVAPTHLEVGIAPGKPTPHAVLSLSKTEAYAERELANIAMIEAAAHQPEAPGVHPSLLGSSHAPKFRQLGNPVAHVHAMSIG